MTPDLQRFIDETIDETLDETIDEAIDAMAGHIRHWLRQHERARGEDRAAARNECLPASLARHRACAQLARLEALPPARRPAQVVMNNVRGRCAEQSLVRRLCARRFDVRNQVRVGPRPGGSVLDVTPFPGTARRIPRGLESKSIHATDWRDAAGRLRLGALPAQVARDVEQVRRHVAHSAGGAALPGRIRIVYQVYGVLTPAEFRAMSQALYGAVAAANARTPHLAPVAATVIRPLR